MSQPSHPVPQQPERPWWYWQVLDFCRRAHDLHHKKGEAWLQAIRRMK